MLKTLYIPHPSHSEHFFNNILKQRGHRITDLSLTSYPHSEQTLTFLLVLHFIFLHPLF